MRLKNKCHLAVLLLVSVVSSEALFAAPSITSLSPASGAVGTSVTITGANFGTTQGTSAVTFNSTPATTITSWSTTSIVVTAPTGATTGGVVVTVGGVASNSVNFTVAMTGFALTGSLATARMFHTATLLNTGTVLVAGGVDGFAYDTITSAELYNPATGAFTTTGNLNAGRIFNTATLLSNGQVLIVGGSDSNWNQIGTVELYNPASGTFTFTGSLNTARTSHSSTLLNNGKVLIAGGWNSNGNYITSDAASGELYDPTTGTFVSTGSLTTARDTHTATLLNDGTVLIAGGFDSNANPLSSAEIYDPVAGTFTLTGSLNIGRAVHTATLLNNGMVLIAGGYDFNGNAVASAELYNPATRSFTVTGSLNTPRYDGAQGTLLNNGMVLLAGGQDNNGNTLASAELYDPATGNFTATMSMNTTRQSLTTTLLNNGQVLVSAGMDYFANVLNSAELYQPSTLTPAGLVSITVSPSSLSVSVGATQLFTATGTFSDNSTQTLDSVTWTSSDSTIAAIANDASNRGNAVAVAPGSVTVSACTGSVCGSTTMTILPPSITSLSPSAGGVGTLVTITGTNFGSIQGTSIVSFNGTAATPTSWSSSSITVPVPSGATAGNVVVTVGGIASNGIIFTVQSVGFVASSGQMETPRYGHTATRLMTGQVLIAGGMSSSGVVNSAELYTPASQTFAAANAMNVARWSHTATLLNDGTVLVAGGSSVSSQTTLNSAEIYDPVAGIFTLLPDTLNTARVGHTSTLLSNGQVLIVGGYDPTTGLIADAELYDPAAQVFIDLGNTNAPRFHHTATLLQNGQVLIAGGETDPTPTGSLNTAEIFNPATWTFTALSVNMTSAREGHAATLLNNGQVLLTGGDPPGAGTVNTAEIYDPSSNTFTAVSSVMTTSRMYHDAVLLNGGKVLLSGGESDSGGNSTVLNTAEVYDPTSQTFTAVAGNTTGIGEYQTATLLNDGTVLLDGGTGGTSIFNTAEIYTTSKLTGLTSIAISPATPSVPLGAQQLLVATGTFSAGSTQVLSSVLWSSSSTSVSVVSNDASDAGFATTVAQGSATITATAAGLSGSTGVTVPAPTLVSIAVTPQSLTMPLGTTQQFAATGTYSDGSVQDLTSTATWTSSSSSATINSAGVATAAVVGNSTIQASSGSQSSSATVTVGSPALVSLSVTPPTATVAAGLTQQYEATGIYTDGSTQNLTNLVTWSAVPQTSASVNSTGLVSATGQGSVALTAFYGGHDGVATLTVGSASLVSIAVSPNETTIPVGSNQQFIATGTYTDGSTQDLTSSVTWTSSTASVSTINTAGLATTVANGATTISASSTSLTGSAVLTVQTGTLTLNTSRYQHSATLLDNGTVLIAGGVSCPSTSSCTYLNSSELYNPSSGTTASTGAMAIARSAPAVLLGNGKVLVAGGYACDSSGNCGSLKSAEIYDPVAGTFSSAGNMTTDRYGHTLTMLNSGQILIADGESCSSATSCSALNSAEIYDPVAGTFTATGSLNAARFNASAIALNSGQVLIAGGYNGASYPPAGELYDLIAGTFSNTPNNLNTPRAGATASLLDNGDVLIAGGTTCVPPGCPSSIAELYSGGDFAYFSYPTSNMTVARWDQTATLLTNGEVLLAGGYDDCPSSCTSDTTTELFNPQGDSLTSSQALSTGRSGHTATLLTDGSVLLIGGIKNGITLASVDSYVPSSLSLPQLASITISPSNQPMVLGTTLPLVATGTDSYGNYLGTLASVVWSSSSSTSANVSNANGSSGIVSAQSVGTTTITASIGTVSASTQITVTAPLVSLSISPSNPSLALNSPQELQLTATGLNSDGSSKDLTGSVTWSTSNSSVAAVIPNPAVPGILAPVAVGTANITATYGAISGSTPVSVVAPVTPVTPNIASVSPASGAAGTQVTLTGSGFGASQGTGTVWLGTTLGMVVSWSDTQVVATVNTGSSTGVAAIQQNNLSSNTLSFTVNTATITGVSPTSGLPGTQVTITGSGFGASQGNGLVWIGTARAIVSSWSDGQVVATVATGSTSGNAQILQNGVWSNPVSFFIDSLQITSISPNSGSAGTVIAITGSGFGNAQGSGTVWIGNTNGVVVGWSDTQISASVASDAVSGVVKVKQNGAWSNSVAFTVPPSLGGGTQVILSPTDIGMVVGDTRSIQAIDSNGQPVTGLTWTSSDTTVLTLSSDDPPILTALAPGVATINTGSAAANVTVYAGPTIPLGQRIWSNQGDGTGVSTIMPAVPSSSGVADVFALNTSGIVQAIRSDGTEAWRQTVVTNSTLLPDFQGGLTVANLNASPASVQKLDGMTGQAYPAYTYTGPGGFGVYPQGTPPVVVHTDGTIFTVDNNAIVALDPATGQPKFSPIGLEQGIDSGNGNCGEYIPFQGFAPSEVGTPIIAGDGYAYFPYWYSVQPLASNTHTCTRDIEVFTDHVDTHLRIMRVGTDGSSLEIDIGDWSADGSSTINHTSCGAACDTSTSTGGVPNLAFLNGTLITNADQGVLYSSDLCLGTPGSQCTQQLTTVTNGSASTVTTGIGAGSFTSIQPVLQRADNSYIGIASTPAGNSMVAFTASGQQLWSQPNDSPQIATSDGGVVGTSGTTYDQHGKVTGQIAQMPTYSWKAAYQLGSADSVAVPLPSLPPTIGAFAGGSPIGKGTAIAVHSIGLFWCGSGFSGTCQGLSDGKGNPEADLGFTYSPKALLPSNNWQVPDANWHDFTSNGSWDNVIIDAALRAVSAAFQNVPVMPPTRPSPLGYGSNKGTPDLVVNIVGNRLVPSPPQSNSTDEAGLTSSRLICQINEYFCNWNSVAYYTMAMFGAQFAKPSLDSPHFPPTTATQQSAFRQLLIAIGTGVGNIAAHEIGHQLQLPDMDCGQPGHVDCPGPPNNPVDEDFLYEHGAYDPTYLDIGPTLKWDSNDSKVLEQKLFKK